MCVSAVKINGPDLPGAPGGGQDLAPTSAGARKPRVTSRTGSGTPALAVPLFIHLFISIFSCRGPQRSRPCRCCRGEVRDVTHPVTSRPWRQSRAGLPRAARGRLPNSCGSPAGAHGRQRGRSPPGACRGGGCDGAAPPASGRPPEGNVGLRGGGKMQAAQGARKKEQLGLFPGFVIICCYSTPSAPYNVEKITNHVYRKKK